MPLAATRRTFSRIMLSFGLMLCIVIAGGPSAAFAAPSSPPPPPALVGKPTASPKAAPAPASLFGCSTPPSITASTSPSRALHGVILVAGTCFTPGDWVWVYVQDATTTLGIVGVWVQASQNYTHCTGFQCYFVPGGAFSYTGATPCASDQRPLDVWAYDLGTNSWTPPVRVLGAECIIP